MLIIKVLALSSHGQVKSLSELLADTCTKSGSLIYTVVEEMPQFPGGEAELFRYLAKMPLYPDCSKEEIIAMPRTRISFVVLEDGRICGVTVRNAWCEDDELELKHSIMKMPAWIPGKQRGKIVAVRYELPLYRCVK